jgi:hypothetical protein
MNMIKAKVVTAPVSIRSFSKAITSTYNGSPCRPSTLEQQLKYMLIHHATNRSFPSYHSSHLLARVSSTSSPATILGNTVQLNV